MQLPKRIEQDVTNEYQGKSILTVDDSKTVRSYLKNLLTRKGAVVDEAGTGEEALVKCTQSHYDFILLDLILPDSDGIQVLQNIRKRNNTSAIIMLTGHGGIRSAITAVQLGADGYLQKQDITASAHDHTEFLFALSQALEHRSGLIAQRQLEDMKADFYSMVTHDLRNPASILVSALELLADQDLGPLTQAQSDFIAHAQRALDKMVRLINDYLDYAKIDAGYLRLEMKPVDLRQVATECAELYALQAAAKQQHLIVRLPAMPVIVIADGERINQVLDNLLSNAIKYTPEGGDVELSMAVDDYDAYFSVRDTGIGITTAQLPGLFTKYYRAPGSSTRGILGTGLGLLIVKEIIEAHGGMITAESSGVRGAGTTFRLKIPLRRAEAPLTEETAKARPVLPAEEDPDDESDEAIFRTFIAETRHQSAVISELLQHYSETPANADLLVKLGQVLHTLKGNAGALNVGVLAETARQMETIVRALGNNPNLNATDDALDELMQGLKEIESWLANA